jgi:orotate phosphoribosyltransferase
MSQTRARLQQLIDERCLSILDNPIRLSTGSMSNIYFDCKAVTLDGEALSLMADLFLEEIDKLPEIPAAIGGLTMGADFITAAVAMRAFDRGMATVRGSIVRKEPKKHGTMTRIENELPKGTSIVVVDDVITTGNATRQACEHLAEAGYRIVGIVALVDREQGGRQALESNYGTVRAVFKRSDFPRIAAHEQGAVSSQAA